MAKTTAKAPTIEQCVETMIELKAGYMHGPILVPALISNEKDLILDKTNNLKGMFLDTNASLVWVFAESKERKETSPIPFSMFKNWLVA